MINHNLECVIECVLHGVITCLSQSRKREQGNDTQGVTNPLSHNTLVDQYYLIYHCCQLIGHSCSNFLVMVTISD